MNRTFESEDYILEWNFKIFAIGVLDVAMICTFLVLRKPAAETKLITE